MGTAQAGRKKGGKAGGRRKKLGFKKSRDTRVRRKDIDQIQEEIATGKSIVVTRFDTSDRADTASRPKNDDLPGQGEHFCQHCDRYFINAVTLGIHLKTKAHRKRVKLLKEAPYSQAEADAAGGVGRT